MTRHEARRLLTFHRINYQLGVRDIYIYIERETAQLDVHKPWKEVHTVTVGVFNNGIVVGIVITKRLVLWRTSCNGLTASETCMSGHVALQELSD